MNCPLCFGHKSIGCVRCAGAGMIPDSEFEFCLDCGRSHAGGECVPIYAADTFARANQMYHFQHGL